MKKILSIVFITFMGTALFAQDANKIVGVWITQDNDGKVSIAQDSEGKYNGTVVWMKDSLDVHGKPVLDSKNSDKKLRDRPVVGINLLEGFKYDESCSKWVDGRIYDPKSGKTYKSLVRLDEDPNILLVKGFVGLSFIGREVVWIREK